MTKQTKDAMEEVTDEYGQLHGQECDLNNENGSDDGCNCAMATLNESVALPKTLLSQSTIGRGQWLRSRQMG